MLLRHVDSIRNRQSMVAIVGAIDLKSSSRFGKRLLISWGQFNLLDNVQISCRIAHVQCEVVDFSILQVKWSRINRVFALLTHKFRYRLIASVPRVKEELTALVLSELHKNYFQIRIVLSVLPVKMVSVFLE